MKKYVVFDIVFMYQGMVLLTLSVSVVHLHYQKTVSFVALYILAVSEGHACKPLQQTSLNRTRLRKRRPRAHSSTGGT